VAKRRIEKKESRINFDWKERVCGRVLKMKNKRDIN
jgi:hypothetical protein